MKLSLPASLAFSLLTVIALIPITALGQTTNLTTQAPGEIEDDAPVQRVARVSFTQGDVSFLRAGVSEWTSAIENLPLLTGDQIYTGRGARAEIQLGRGNYIRLSQHTALTISDLSHTSAQLEITEGVAIIRLERFGTAFDRFEVDTPNAALVLEQDGLYRVNVRGDEVSEVISRRGSIEVTTSDGSFKVREGHRLLIDTGSQGRLELAIDDSRDDWDQWSYDRDTHIDRVVVASSPDYVTNYETNYHCFYGVSDLASHGTWTNISSYGYCWIPRVSAGWAPYRHGQWLWIPSVGWSWLSHEPWGWAPYHYGRWAFINGLGWAWVPGFRRNFGHSYYQWRPALVSFFNCPTPRGNYVGWYPLAPGERWRRPSWNHRSSDHSHLQYPSAQGGWRRPDSNHSDWRRPVAREGVTIQPVEGFTRPSASASRPEAPGRDLHHWIGNGARPGLPEVTPTEAAASPTWHRSDRPRETRRAVAPPTEVINRPVITRRSPSDPQVVANVPRERRLIPSRRVKDVTEIAMPKERKPRHGGEDRASDSSSQTSDRHQDHDDQREHRTRIRPPQPVASDQTSGEHPASEKERERESRRERRRSAEQSQDDSAQNNGTQSNSAQGDNANNADDAANDKGRSRSRLTHVPGPRESRASGDGGNGEEGETRAKRERSRPREDDSSEGGENRRARRNNDSDGQAGEARQERSHARPEQRDQEREQRRQEKEERRQERREEREQRKRGQE